MAASGRSEDVHDTIGTSYVNSIYVLCPRGRYILKVKKVQEHSIITKKLFQEKWEILITELGNVINHCLYMTETHPEQCQTSKMAGFPKIDDG